MSIPRIGANKPRKRPTLASILGFAIATLLVVAVILGLVVIIGWLGSIIIGMVSA